MNEELIRQCAREAEEGTRGASVGEVREAAELAIRIYHARAVAPLEQLAADILKLANDAAAVLRESEQDRERLKQELAALRANVAPLVEAVNGLLAWDRESNCRRLTYRVRDPLHAALAPFQQEADSPAFDPEDYCEGCGNGDKVPASGYWRCPKCDAEWPGEA